MSSGGYPLGAQYDPRAPYNRRDEPCVYCNGTGNVFVAYETRQQRLVKVSELAYQILPETEAEAEARGGHYCKDHIESCPHCDGIGKIFL